MRISERGRITIPKHLRERFGMNHNVEVEISRPSRGSSSASAQPPSILSTASPASSAKTPSARVSA